MRRFHPSKPKAVLLDVVAWGLVHALTGYLVHRLPARLLTRDTWLFRARAFEDGGRFYSRRLHIKRWKDRLPEAGALFAGGLSKRHLPNDERGGLERFVVETRRAELGHWLAAAAGPGFVLWNPPAATAIHVAYGVGVNLPFVAIQRYNRLRATRVLARRAAALRSSAAGAEARRERRSSGSSIP